MKARHLGILVACLLALAVVAPAQADLTIGFSQDTLAASVTFDVQGNNLIATLRNVSTFGATAPEEILTGVYFNIYGTGTLTPEMAVLSTGSVVHFPVAGDGTDSNGEIGGEYAYMDGVPGVPSGATHVISAVGLDDLIGATSLFPGGSLWGPPSDAPNGLGYGIVSAADDLSIGNKKVTGEVPLVQDGVVFTLSGLSDDFVLEGSISDVMFNYGTEFNPVPAPGACALGALGLGMIGWYRRRPA